ncbi:MAG: thermonuclease family protein [Acidimicrobiales bacterium]
MAGWARARSSSASEAFAGVLLAGVLLAGCTTTKPTSTAATTRAAGAVTANSTVTRVVDGDTIIADIGGHDTRVRMIGFNTPESVDPRRPVECFGKEASKHLSSLAPAGTPIRLERDAEQLDRYGRTLAYVYRASDGMFLNLQMVTDGYAHALTIPPNVTYADRFRAAERAARTAGIGLWAACPDS